MGIRAKVGIMKTEGEELKDTRKCERERKKEVKKSAKVPDLKEKVIGLSDDK